MVRNVDGTRNVLGTIKKYIDVKVDIEGHSSMTRFYVTGLGNEEVILGLPWLRHHNPEIDWAKDGIAFTRCPPVCQMTTENFKKVSPVATQKGTTGRLANARLLSHLRQPPSLHDDILSFFSKNTSPTAQEGAEEFLRAYFMEKGGEMIDIEDGDEVFWNSGEEDNSEAYIARVSQAQQMAEEAASKEQKTLEEMVPSAYAEYHKVFSEEEAQRFPESRPWDHEIELKDDAPQSLNCKVYPLTPAEQEAQSKMLEEHLKKGYIRPSNSPYASPFFFVKKKDGKLRPVQDYRQLNDLTIKNHYPLPLIPELIDKLKDAEIFTKFDV